jgi:hypothetical protein
VFQIQIQKQFSSSVIYIQIFYFQWESCRLNTDTEFCFFDYIWKKIISYRNGRLYATLYPHEWKVVSLYIFHGFRSFWPQLTSKFAKIYKRCTWWCKHFNSTPYWLILMLIEVKKIEIRGKCKVKSPFTPVDDRAQMQRRSIRVIQRPI